MRVLGLLATIDHVGADTDDDDGANGHGGHVVALGLLLGGLFLFGLGLGHVLIGKGLVGVGDGLDQAVVVSIVVTRDELLGEIALLEVVAHLLEHGLALNIGVLGCSLAGLVGQGGTGLGAFFGLHGLVDGQVLLDEFLLQGVEIGADAGGAVVAVLHRRAC